MARGVICAPVFVYVTTMCQFLPCHSNKILLLLLFTILICTKRVQKMQLTLSEQKMCTNASSKMQLTDTQIQMQNLIEDDTGRGVIPNSQTHTPHSDDRRLSLMHMSWTFENFEFQIFNPPAKRSHILMTAGRHSWAFLEDLRLQLTISKNTKCKFSAPGLSF